MPFSFNRRCGRPYWHVEDQYGNGYCPACNFQWEVMWPRRTVRAVAFTLPWGHVLHNVILEYVAGGEQIQDVELRRRRASMYLVLSGPQDAIAQLRRLTTDGFVHLRELRSARESGDAAPFMHRRNLLETIIVFLTGLNSSCNCGRWHGVS